MKSKKKIFLIGGITLAVIIAIILCIVLTPKDTKQSDDKTAKTSSMEKSDVKVEEPTKDKNTEPTVLNTDGIVDDGTGLKPDESKAKSSTTNEIKEFKDKPKQSEKAALPEQSKPEVKPEANVVTKANPDTGISWDGKSQIVYTYKDGTTGTEKKNGAKYELIPGVIRVYMNADEKQWDGTCSHCGKVSGDGKNGTCVRWLMGDMTCPNCGTFVSHGKCHTCN